MRGSRTMLAAATTLSALTMASTAMATPSGEPKCTTNITTPAGGYGALYAEDCRTVYVQPPAVADATVSAVSLRQNLDFCPGVRQANQAANSTLTSAATLAARIETMIASFDPLNATIGQIERDLAAATLTRNVAEAALDSATEERAILEDDLREAQAALADCRLIAIDPVLECQADADLVTANRTALRTFLQSTFLPAQRAFSAADAVVSSHTSRLTRETTRYARAIEPLIDLQDSLFSLNATIFQVYQQYTRLAGLSATLNYSIGWGNLLTAYQAANPGKVITRLPIKNTKLSAAVAIEDAQTDVPGILSFSIPGVISGSNFVSLPTGDLVDGLADEQDPATQYEDVFADGIGGQMLVSLMAACPFYPNGIADAPARDINELTANMALNVHYTYDVKVRRGYTARYNLSQWLTRVERKAKRGGLFSSKTIHEIMEDGNSSDWFEIVFDSTDSEFQYTAAEQERITREVKGQLIERALRNLAIQTSMLAGPSAQPLSIPPTGAGQAASYLISGCGFWSWCQVGGWALGVLDSIFGRSEAVSTFHRNNNVWVTDRVSGVAVLTRPGSLTFAPPATL